MIDLREVYDLNKNGDHLGIIDCGWGSEKPIVTTGLFKNGDGIKLSAGFPTNFCIDDKAMYDLIDIYEKKWNKLDEVAKKHDITKVENIYFSVDEYLGGKEQGNNKKRYSLYLNRKDDNVYASEIKGQKVGKCIERSLLAHQLFSLLKLGNQIGFDSMIVNSRMGYENNRGPHTFLLLKSDIPSAGLLLFDIENTLDFKNTKTGEETGKLGLYSLTQEESDILLNGGNIKPTNIFCNYGFEQITSPIDFGQSDPKDIKKTI